MEFEYKRYILPSGDVIARPVIPVLIRNPRNNASIEYETLVDSGADRCDFPSEIGEMIGIDIEAGEQHLPAPDRARSPTRHAQAARSASNDMAPPSPLSRTPFVLRSGERANEGVED